MVGTFYEGNPVKIRYLQSCTSFNCLYPGIFMRLITTCLCCFWLLASATAQNLYYTVKFPDDRTFIGCNASVPVEPPVITQYNCNLNVGVSRFDQVFTSNEPGTCYKILRRWRLNYWCDYNANIAPTYIPNPENSDIGPTVQGTSANHGYLEYIQVIKVRDAEPPVFANCPASPVVFCDFSNNNTALWSQPPHYDLCEGPVDLQIDLTDSCSGNDLTLNYRLYLDLDGNGSMETYVYSGAPNAWPVELTTPNNLLRGRIVFPQGYQLPYGTHKIEWIAGDKCGNEAICKYEFEVKDCKNPTIVCINGLSANLMQSGMVSLWASDFVQYTLDNCTPSHQIKIAIRKAGAGSGFPTGVQEVIFDCNEVGLQQVEVWAQDAAGNADFCLTYVLIQDNMGACAPTSHLSGTVMKPSGEPAESIQVSVMSPSQVGVGSAYTNANGHFETQALLPGCYQLTPNTLQNNPAEGVSTWDALLLGLHHLGVQNLNAPWQYAAADVNGDGLLTEQDADAIVQIAIGGAQQWPGANAWTFIPANAGLPAEYIDLDVPQTVCVAAQASAQAHWLAVKTGDLDDSASANVQTVENEERGGEEKRITFTTHERHFTAGETFSVTLMAPAADGLAGFQFTLAYAPEWLHLESVTPAFVPAQHIVHFDEEHQLTVGWQDAVVFYPDGAQLYSGKAAFTLVFKALGDGQLSNALSMHSERIQAAAYFRSMQTKSVGLRFLPPTPQRMQAQLFAPTPNPAPGGVITVRYWLPETTEALIWLNDVEGRSRVQAQVDGSAGYHEVVLPLDAHWNGMHLLQLSTTYGISAQRVLIQR